MNGTPQGTTHRELKTVLFADVAGYARLTESNEELTHSNLCDRFSLISSLIRHHNGVIHRTEGDSILATFPAATHALQCAVDIQTASSEQNNNIDNEISLRFRIGINCGEVLLDKGEAFGNCVNIAKRLEAIAKPGEIVFSETLFSHVHRILPYKYRYLGKKHLKNLKKRLKIYSIRLAQETQSINFLSAIKHKICGNISPAPALTIAVALLLFSNNLSFGGIQRGQFNALDISNTTSSPKDDINIKERLIVEAHAKFDAYDLINNNLSEKYSEQAILLAELEENYKKILRKKNNMAEKLLEIENKLYTKEKIINEYSHENDALIEANTELITKLDKVVSKQALRTYKDLYAEYNPVRQQIIGIIESQSKSHVLSENIPNCSIYTNEAVKPHSPESAKGAIRAELQCQKILNENVPIPPSKIAEPTIYRKELVPKEKKVIIYAHIPSLPHQTVKVTKAINKNIVELYKNALSHSSLQSYKTDFVLLSPPANGNNLTNIDTEHCEVYGADYIASVRLNSASNYNLPRSSALVIHNCKTESSAKRNTRHLLSDSWKSNGELYLTPSTLDSFNLQVHSIVDLALNKHPNLELEL